MSVENRLAGILERIDRANGQFDTVVRRYARSQILKYEARAMHDLLVALLEERQIWLAAYEITAPLKLGDRLCKADTALRRFAGEE